MAATASAAAIRQPQRQPCPAPRGPGPIGRLASDKRTSWQLRRHEANHGYASGAKPAANLVLSQPKQGDGGTDADQLRSNDAVQSDRARGALRRPRSDALR